MITNKIARSAALVVATQAGLACSRFVFHEEPFTPDPAPASETLVTGGDTTYVLKAPSYYLLSSQRDALWNREVLDDVAWRYHELFGDAPSLIAIRLDSTTVDDSSATWRGVPFARVAFRHHTEAAPEAKSTSHGRGPVVDDSVRARVLAGPMLAATAAETWIRARTLDATHLSDSQPGGPVRTSNAPATLPTWMETGALAILGGGGAEERANDELRADPKDIMPLASLFATTAARPNAMEIVRAGAKRFGFGQAGRQHDAAARAPERRDVAPGASPLFISQSVSVLTFLRDRDREIVPKLADELARGGSIPDVLASSVTLPHDVAALDAAWREWVKQGQRRHR